METMQEYLIKSRSNARFSNQIIVEFYDVRFANNSSIIIKEHAILNTFVEKHDDLLHKLFFILKTWDHMH
jgi:hypothetical protein